MPPSKKVFLNALIFRKVLLNNTKMILLRLFLRDAHRKRIANVRMQDLDDPNRERVDLNKGEKEFQALL